MKNQPHILYAEDDADTLEVVQLILSHAGFRVSVTGDSAEVMQLLATDTFDVLLLDNWMPKLNGIELCRLIRSLDQNLPIFFCSGAVTEADKKAAFEVGANGYLAKPFDPDELIQSLRSALSNPSIVV
jgi:DNA-binding response OmpR family regulator